MATPSTPSTPAAQKEEQPATPGTWRHPQFDEITRRQHAHNFDDRNVRQLIWSGGLLVWTYLVKSFILRFAALRALSKPVFILSAAYPTAFTWVATAIRAIFVWNIVTALLPLFRRWNTDDIVDIALTPEQRLAMGLDPNKSTPVVPGSTYVSPNYVTPPRYQKSTPRSSLSNQGDKSPLSGTGSPRGLGQSTSQSPFSPSSGSPLFHRALGGSTGRRLSYDRQSPLASSLFSDSTSSNTPGTPTPVVGRASVSLNNKWLYEKGRSSSRSGLYS